MDLSEIKSALGEGKKVHWSNQGYIVEMSSREYLCPITLQYIPCEEYEIVCTANEHRVGLTWTDGVTLNGKEEDFYVGEG